MVAEVKRLRPRKAQRAGRKRQMEEWSGYATNRFAAATPEFSPPSM